MIYPHDTIMVSLLSASIPPRVVTDRIVPLHFFDDTIVWRSFVLYSLFVFDCVLDAEKLHASLGRLVNKDGWWKLGARLRRNVGFVGRLQPVQLC